MYLTYWNDAKVRINNETTHIIRGKNDDGCRFSLFCPILMGTKNDSTWYEEPV